MRPHREGGEDVGVVVGKRRSVVGLEVMVEEMAEERWDGVQPVVLGETVVSLLSWGENCLFLWDDILINVIYVIGGSRVVYSH